MLLLAISFMFMQKTYTNQHPVPKLVPIKIQDTVLPLPTIPDTLKADSLYKGGRESYMHFKPYNPRPDTISLKLVLDSNDYTAPVGGKKSSGYGWRWGRMHYGVDIAYNNYDTTYATFDGVVRWSRYGYNGGYGNLIVMRHPNGLETYYAHFRQLLVEEGDTIKSGTPIGIIGTTGRSGGPHLHYEMRFLGAAINPESLIDVDSFTLIYDSVTLVRDHDQYVVSL